MKPVLCLFVDQGLGRVHDRIGDFLVAMGGKTVHEIRILPG